MTDDSPVFAGLAALRGALAEPGARPVFVTGAGVSVASGVPTFRGPDPDAVWSRTVTEMGTHRFFQRDPVASWRFYLDRFDALRGARANAAHRALVELERRNPALVVVTQNIDGLHADAGTTNLIEIHGSCRKVRCSRSGCPEGAQTGVQPWNDGDFDSFRSRRTLDALPRCGRCSSLLRPHILWFDETYTSHEDYGFQRFQDASYDWTALVFVGTSHSVGITERALEAATLDDIPVFDIDPNSTLDPAAAIRIQAPAEQALPALLT